MNIAIPIILSILLIVIGTLSIYFLQYENKSKYIYIKNNRGYIGHCSYVHELEKSNWTSNSKYMFTFNKPSDFTTWELIKMDGFFLIQNKASKLFIRLSDDDNDVIEIDKGCQKHEHAKRLLYSSELDLDNIDDSFKWSIEGATIKNISTNTFICSCGGAKHDNCEDASAPLFTCSSPSNNNTTFSIVDI